MPPRARSRRSISARGKTLADEINDLASNTVVEAELKELKSKLGKGRAPSSEA